MRKIKKLLIGLLVIALLVAVAISPVRALEAMLPQILTLSGEVATTTNGFMGSSHSSCWGRDGLSVKSFEVQENVTLNLSTIGGAVTLGEGFHAKAGSKMTISNHEEPLNGLGFAWLSSYQQCPFFNTYNLYDGIGRTCGVGCRIMYFPITLTEEEYEFYVDIADGQLSQATYDKHFPPGSETQWEFAFGDQGIYEAISYFEKSGGSFGDGYWYLYEPHNIRPVKGPQGQQMYVQMPRGEINPSASSQASAEELKNNVVDMLLPYVPVANIGYFFVTGISGSNFSGPLTSVEREGNLVFGTVEVVMLGGLYLDAVKLKSAASLSDDVVVVGKDKVIASYKAAVETNPKNVVHIMEGVAKGPDSVVGFHHRYLGKNPANSYVIEDTIQRGTRTDGVYHAKVQISDPIKGYSGTKDSTFFPDSWTRERVLREIDEAFATKSFTSHVSGRQWRGTSSSGLVVEGYVLDSNPNYINSAYPYWAY